MNQPKTILENEFLFCWELSETAKKEASLYYILHWSGITLKNRLSFENRILQWNKTRFLVQWPSPEAVDEILKATRVGLSFRKMKGTNLGIVIPKIMQGMSAP